MFTRRFLLDAAERAVRTFAQAFGSVFVLTDLTTAKTAAVAGLSAAISVVFSIIANPVGDKGTAALLPSKGGE